MDLGHPLSEFACQITTREMDVLEGRGQVTMASKSRNGMEFPPRACQIGQAQMAQRMGTELRHIGA